MTKMVMALPGVSSRAMYCKLSNILYIKENSYEAAYSPAYKGLAVGGISVHVAQTSISRHNSACEAFQALAATYCWPKDAPVSTRSCTAALEGRRPRG